MISSMCKDSFVAPRSNPLMRMFPNGTGILSRLNVRGRGGSAREHIPSERGERSAWKPRSGRTAPTQLVPAARYGLFRRAHSLLHHAHPWAGCALANVRLLAPLHAQLAAGVHLQ